MGDTHEKSGRYYVSYDLYAPAMDEWIPHVVDITLKFETGKSHDRPEDYAAKWWSEHLTKLADRGELRNYRADWGHPADATEVAPR